MYLQFIKRPICLAYSSGTQPDIIPKRAKNKLKTDWSQVQYYMTQKSFLFQLTNVNPLNRNLESEKKQIGYVQLTFNLYW